MKAPRPWLYLPVLSVVICFGLAVAYLFSIKKIRPPFAMPVVIDSLAETGNVWNVTTQQMYIHEPLYVGKWQEHILVQRPPDWESFHYDIWGENSRNYREADSTDLQLLVDTTRRVAYDTEDRYGDRIEQYINKSYPLMLANLSDDTLCVGYGNDIAFLQEAIDSTGNWKPIESHFMFLCGTGIPGIRLAPEEIVVLAVPVYEGTYRTRMRVRYWSAVSNEFVGNINPSQFILR